MCHGQREIALVSFEKDGQAVELVAFDPRVDGFAQVKAVWPGPVDQFFTRHASAGVRELFVEMSNRSGCGLTVAAAGP